MLRVLLTAPIDVRCSIGVRTAARLTGYHPATIRRALLRGDLEGYRAGTRGAYRIPPGAIDDWLRPAHETNEEAST